MTTPFRWGGPHRRTLALGPLEVLAKLFQANPPRHSCKENLTSTKGRGCSSWEWRDSPLLAFIGVAPTMGTSLPIGFNEIPKLWWKFFDPRTTLIEYKLPHPKYSISASQVGWLLMWGRVSELGRLLEGTASPSRQCNPGCPAHYRPMDYYADVYKPFSSSPLGEVVYVARPKTTSRKALRSQGFRLLEKSFLVIPPPDLSMPPQGFHFYEKTISTTAPTIADCSPYVIILLYTSDISGISFQTYLPVDLVVLSLYSSPFSTYIKATLPL
ncbi:hypothetical protein Acr_23g0011610 [Actinidia rufa]|uniref:Uncharacterized protein n=1 Tax=Actinidia rufa TaxID=165716 RepID=A0A7J0GPN2_9ERIC|nr:hypothetical protein Acr_23g0011610 [Actinidia rufa]